MTKNEKDELLDLLQAEINRAQRKEMDLYNESRHWHGKLVQAEYLRAAVAKIETEVGEHPLKVCGECVAFEKCRDEQGVVYHNSECHAYQVKTCGTCIDCDDCDMCLTVNSPPCGSWRSNEENI